MEFDNTPRIIKPKLINKGIIFAIIIIIIFLIYVFIIERDVFLLLSSAIIIFITILAVILYLNKIVIVGDSSFIYKSLFYKMECEYEKILSVDIALQKVQGSYKFFLIINADKPILISNLQLYRKDEICSFINHIKVKKDELNVNDIILLLDKVKWII